jgi:hypothetical protein
MNRFINFFSDDKELAAYFLNSTDLFKAISLDDFRSKLKANEKFLTVFDYIFLKIYPFDPKSKYMKNKLVEFINQITFDTKRKDIIDFLRHDDFFLEFYENELKNFLQNSSDEFKLELITNLQKLDIETLKISLYDTFKNLISDYEIKQKQNIKELSNKFAEIYIEKNKCCPSTILKNKFVQYISNKDDISEFFVHEFIKQCSEHVFEVILEFEHIFKREMTVHEYIYFKDEINTKKNGIWIQNYFEKYNEKFVITKNIFKNFLNQKLTDSFFCRHYLEYIDANIVRFKNKTTDKVLTLSSYNSQIKKIVSDVHMNIYQSSLSQFQLEHLILKCKMEKVHLYDPTIQSVVAEFKNEIDDLKVIILAIYQKMLRRSAFDYEINDALSFYMKKNKKSTIVKDEFEFLYEKLFYSLEFDDVVKNVICYNKIDVDNNCFVLLENFNEKKKKLENFIWTDDDIINLVLDDSI